MKKGFTLIELLIVVAIIGILSVALVPTGMNALKKARDGTRIAHVATIAGVLSEYNLDTGATQFAKGASTQAFQGQVCVNSAYKTPASAANADFDPAVKAYFKSSKPPVDPQGSTKSFNNTNNDTQPYSENCSYYVTSGSSHFAVWARMEAEEMGNYDPSKHSDKYPLSLKGSATENPTDTGSNFTVDAGGKYYFLRKEYVK